MKLFRLLITLVALATFVGLTGCSTLQAKLDTQVQAATIPDLTAALAAANAATPPDTEGAACWTDMISYINALPTAGATGTLPPIVGVASALEASRGLNVGQPLAIPPIPEQLHRDCAVVVIDAQTLAAKLGLAGAAAAKGLLPLAPIKP